ncbi:hypothetical protein K0U83_25025 [bacterium]|nr:hypothetical protein [bacterium]
MLVELAAANAAFAVIKEAVHNSGDLMNAGQALFRYFDNKAAIQQAANKKAKPGQQKNDLEEFMALEQLKRQEVELKEMMIYNGRGGMWDDWLQFQAQAARKREEERKAALREALRVRESRIEALWWGVLAVVMAGAIYLFVMVYSLFSERNS